ncbi:MAG TPA: helix-hairpin-helix domain-containing protein [Acidisarcina sp.]
MKSISDQKTLARAVTLALLAAASAMLACNKPQTQQQEDQQIQQQAAKTTEQVKSDAKVAAEEAKVATADAGRKLKDIAVGVREGLHNGSSGDSAAADSKPSAGRIDLNAASEDELASLPGIDDAKAKYIIAGRPYSSSHDLVAKGILSQSRYERIARRVTAR